MQIRDIDSATTCSFCMSAEDGTLSPGALVPGDEQETHVFRLGMIIGGRYLLERLLGSGGMGQVFAARDLRLERLVAIKVVKHQLTRAEELERTLAREARLGASLNHPGIATVYDFGFQGIRSYTVFEFVEGETLRQVLCNRGSIPLSEVLVIAKQLGQALDFAHAKGVVHRDLKPENICCAKNGELKILDLGLARDIHAELECHRYSGTPAYSSPEQCACLPTDGRSDQYSLALIIFEMLTGRRAFQATSPLQLLQQQQTIACPCPSQFLPDLPGHIDQVLQRALNKQAGHRYASCGEFANELVGPNPEAIAVPAVRSHRLATGQLNRVAFYMAVVADLTPIARSLVDKLHSLRYSSWLFNRDATAAVSSQKQSQAAIERSAIVVALLSRSGLRSTEFAWEIEYAHQLRIPIVPLLVDLTRAELHSAAPAWYSLLSACPPVDVPDGAWTQSTAELLRSTAKQLGIMPDLEEPKSDRNVIHNYDGLPWATDANQIDIHSLDHVLFRNAAVDEFLRSRQKHFISAPKGFGKTLLLTCKRHLLARSDQQLIQARFIPEGRPFLDFMSELRSLSARYETPLGDLNNTKRWWSAALRISAISHHSDIIGPDDRVELASYPARINRWLISGKVQPTVVFKELVSLNVRELNQFIDSSENFLDLKMRQVHGTSWFFIDKVDQAIRHLSREAWIAIQAGLVEAAWETMNANSHIKIYASIRQEAFTNYRSDIKSNLFSAITNLQYTEAELLAIVDQLAQCYEGCRSFQDFMGMHVIRHAKRPIPENSYKYVRRHTSGRPRDLVAIASALSPQRKTLTEKQLRTIVQQTSANVLVSNVFDEVRAFLNCLHDPEARLRLLSLMPANILVKADAIGICEQFNGLAPGTLHHFGQDSTDIYHPFRDLYFTGLLGTLQADPEEGVTIQRFRRASDPLSSSVFDLPESAIYLMHPALDTFIRSHASRTSFLQYQHIAVGEDLPWLEYYPIIMHIERDLQSCNDPQFVQLTHDVIRHIQSLLQADLTNYARLEVEYSAAWQRLSSYQLNSVQADIVFWLTELLEYLSSASG